MGMRPKPARHDRRSYSNTHGNAWREADNAQQEQAKKMPGVLPPHYPNGSVQGCTLGQNEAIPNPNNGVAKKTAKPKTFTTSDIEYSVIKALTPVLQARDGTVYSFSDWTVAWDGNGVVLVLPNGQEFWLTISETK